MQKTFQSYHSLPYSLLARKGLSTTPNLSPSFTNFPFTRGLERTSATCSSVEMYCNLTTPLFCRERYVRPVLSEVISSGIQVSGHRRLVYAQGESLRLQSLKRLNCSRTLATLTCLVCRGCASRTNSRQSNSQYDAYLKILFFQLSR